MKVILIDEIRGLGSRGDVINVNDQGDASGNTYTIANTTISRTGITDIMYSSVETGEEARRTLEANSRPDYRVQLEKELKAIADSEMWKAGAQVRALRPERQG